MKPLVVLTLLLSAASTGCMQWHEARENEVAKEIQSLGGKTSIHTRFSDGDIEFGDWVHLMVVGYEPIDEVNLADVNLEKFDLGLLKELWGLERLTLVGDQTTDAQLKKLADLKGLRSLNLSDTAVTDAGLKELQALWNLELLNLTNTRVTDAGMKDLAGMAGLCKLVLQNVAVTDAGLMELKDLKTLRLLTLAGTKITSAGIEALRQASPAVQINQY